MEDILKFIEFNQYNLPFLLEIMGLYFVLLYVAVVAWVYRDITTRSDSFLTAVAATLFVLVGNIPALVIYLLVRPERTLDDNRTNNLFYASVLDKSITSCPDCHSLVRQDYKYCPTCSALVQVHCPDCGEIVNPFWQFCSNCNYRLSKPSKLATLTARIGKLFTNIRTPKLPEIRLGKPALSLPKFRLPAFSLPKLSLKLPKLNLQIRKFSFKKPALKVVAEKRHQPKLTEKTAVVVEKVATKPAANAKQAKKSKRGRPKGIKDNKPRKQRADAGRKRGKYSKS